MRDGKPTCSDCGAFIAVLEDVNAGLCLACQRKQEQLLCQCGDCQRKRAAEDPAFALHLRAQRILDTIASKPCVECGVLMRPGAHRYSLACPSCVEKLGTDEETGRFDGRPEPKELKESA